jgi:hypothetical protein
MDYEENELGLVSLKDLPCIPDIRMVQNSDGNIRVP